MLPLANIPAGPESLSILMIDDEPELRNIYRHLLELEGHRVFGANSGPEGLRIAAEVRPGLVICDMSMPEMDGMAVLRALRKSPPTRETPFVFLTGNEDISRMRGEASRLGVADFIAKPCPLAALRAEIATIARRFGLLQLNMNTLMNLPKSA